MEDWEFSSFKDYAQKRQGTLCYQQLAATYLDFTPETFCRESYAVIPESLIRKLYPE